MQLAVKISAFLHIIEHKAELELQPWHIWLIWAEAAVLTLLVYIMCFTHQCQCAFPLCCACYKTIVMQPHCSFSKARLHLYRMCEEQLQRWPKWQQQYLAAVWQNTTRFTESCHPATHTPGTQLCYCEAHHPRKAHAACLLSAAEMSTQSSTYVSRYGRHVQVKPSSTTSQATSELWELRALLPLAEPEDSGESAVVTTQRLRAAVAPETVLQAQATPVEQLVIQLRELTQRMALLRMSNQAAGTGTSGTPHN